MSYEHLEIVCQCEVQAVNRYEINDGTSYLKQLCGVNPGQRSFEFLIPNILRDIQNSFCLMNW